MNCRFSFIEGREEQGEETLCEAVHIGLTSRPKTLPCRFFYDQQGSELFERITQLPEYYLTRCETEILQAHASEIIEAAGADLVITEFGSGSSTKTRLLIEAALMRQSTLEYQPIDISRDFLKASAEELLNDYPNLCVTAIGAEYSQAMNHLPPAEGPRLILFLGSNIGNFEKCEAAQFLTTISNMMRSSDRLLVGADLIKDRAILEAAYNDPEGITAKFNKNLLARIDRELHGGFDLSRFKHDAPFDEQHSRIEMRLISQGDQHVKIDDLETIYDFIDGEFILTEWSHKYSRESFAKLAHEANLSIANEWTDSKNWFSTFLLRLA